MTIARGDEELREMGEGRDAQESVADAQDNQEEDDEPSQIVVHVDGAVAEPGVVCLEGEGLRIADAVEAAGGLAGDADTVAINLAARIEDGQKIHIPNEGELAAAPLPEAASASSESQGELVNLNTADASQLQELPGIGERTAEAIIRDREQNGSFTCKEDLMRVSGIGEKKFERLESLVTV